MKLVRAHSTELRGAERLGAGQRASLVVSELLHTDLIGEGALPTMRHARRH